MPVNPDVQDFFELRAGFQGMSDFAGAALRFLDKFGIAITNGHANGYGKTNGAAKNVEALREKVTHHYKQRKKYKKRKPATQTIVATAAPGAKGAAPSKYVMTGAERRIAGRLASAAILDALDRVTPRPGPIGKAALSMGALVRRGYARKKGDGYIRTAKVFIADDRQRQGRHRTTPEAPETQEQGETNDTITAIEAAAIIKISDSYVRQLVKQGRLSAHKGLRPRVGGTKLIPQLILNRDEVVRFAADHNATA